MAYSQRLERALGVSIGSHVAVGLMVLAGFRYLAPANETGSPSIQLPDLVWLVDPGPGGGGGGGGNTKAEPPRKAEITRTDPVPVQALPPEPQPPEPEPLAPIASRIPVDATLTTPGALEATDATSLSQGPGSGGGGDRGTGPGIGPDRGRGLGPGAEAGAGGETFRPGDGVTAPRVLLEVKPAYTAEAMRAKVQGLVRLECVVLPDGSVGRVVVVKSLDSTFGLDQQAVKAARQWRFAPGRRLGEPVAVLVIIDLEFRLR